MIGATATRFVNGIFEDGEVRSQSFREYTEALHSEGEAIQRAGLWYRPNGRSFCLRRRKFVMAWQQQPALALEAEREPRMLERQHYLWEWPGSR
jgi:hypothetical protein